jgi:AcrR family transcriptional regulator
MKSVRPVNRLGKPGRPLSFDRQTALERAMHLFWRYGYEATSLNDLTTGMGITPPSLYTAFGNKERLFLEAVQCYLAGPGSGAAKILVEAPTAREAIRDLLDWVAVQYTDRRYPPGCLVAAAAVNCSAESIHVQAALTDTRKAVETRIRARIEQGQRAGELPASTDAAALGSFYATVIQGMSAQARDGATRKRLRSIAAAAMGAWPARR